MNSYEPNTNNNIKQLEQMMEESNVTNIQGWWGVHPATEEDEPICLHCKVMEQDEEIDTLQRQITKLQGEVEFLMVQAISK